MSRYYIFYVKANNFKCWLVCSGLCDSLEVIPGSLIKCHRLYKRNYTVYHVTCLCSFCTKSDGRIAALLLPMYRIPVLNPTLKSAISREALRVSLQSLHSNSRALSQVSTRQLPFTLLPIQSSPVVISFYAFYSELVTEKNINRTIKHLYFRLRNKVFNSPCMFLQNYATFSIG
jgi:hypothetical protein